MKNKITLNWVFVIIIQLTIAAYQLGKNKFSFDGSSKYYLFLYYFLIAISFIIIIGFISNFKKFKTQPIKIRSVYYIELITSIFFLLSTAYYQL